MNFLSSIKSFESKTKKFKEFKKKIIINIYIGKLRKDELTVFKKEIELAIREKDSLLILPICDK